MMMPAGLHDLLLKLWQELGLTSPFVTHDLDEALYLVNRVIVLGASPGTVAYRVNAPLAYPRRHVETRSDPVYLALRGHLHRLRTRQVLAGREEAS